MHGSATAQVRTLVDRYWPFPKSPRYFGTTATATVPARVASNSVASEIRAQQNGFE
jgi:hypothetical protein